MAKCKIRNTCFNYHMIKFGIFVKDKTVEFLYNDMFIIGKFYIHKCRFFKVTPNFAAFKNDLKLFSRSLKKIEKESASRLHEILDLCMN